MGQKLILLALVPGRAGLQWVHAAAVQFSLSLRSYDSADLMVLEVRMTASSDIRSLLWSLVVVSRKRTGDSGAKVPTVLQTPSFLSVTGLDVTI